MKSFHFQLSFASVQKKLANNFSLSESFRGEGGGREKNRSWRSAGRARRHAGRRTSMNGERNAEDVGEVGNRSVEWEASPLPLLQPLPPPPHSAASPFGTTSLHPRNHVGTPTTVYHRRRPTSNRPAAKLLPVQGCANQPPCSGSPFTTLCLRGSIFSLAEKKKLANREEI